MCDDWSKDRDSPGITECSNSGLESDGGHTGCLDLFFFSSSSSPAVIKE